MVHKDPAARSRYNRSYKQKNQAQLMQKRRLYYLKNKEKLLEQQKAYRQALPREVLLERRARWYAAHLARQKKHYHVTRAWLPWLNALRGSKTRAKRDNVPFSLTKEWASARWTGRCEVTGIEFILSTKRRPYLFSPSLDRIIPSQGYTPENCRFILHAVNALKGAGTDEDMYFIAKSIVDNLTLKGHHALPPSPYPQAPLTDFAETKS